MAIINALDRYSHFGEFNDPLETQEGVLTPSVRKARARANIGSDGVFSDPVVQALTATAAVNEATNIVTLNHASVIIAATMTAPKNKTVVVQNTSSTGTAAHKVTLSGGSWNGTNTIATLDAPGEQIIVAFDKDGNGTVISNVGAVAFSGP